MKQNELLPDDLHYIVSRLPKDLLSLMKQYQVWLAGGCIRAMVAREQVSDYDLLGMTKAQLSHVALILCEKRQGRMWKTDNAVTVLAPPRTPVQFITRWVYKAPEEVPPSFDFTISQAVMWWEPSPGVWRSLISPRFYPDLAAKRLYYTSPERDEDAGGSILRVLKFLHRGYGIAPESLGRVIARLMKGILDNPDLRPSLVKEKQLGAALSGLMRAVDPLTVIDGLDVMEEEEE